jgi:histidyl-tRNA synthetase|tara:strand:+ start:454 stop:1710 length:1257 start_codon:yes stop_codon:yes gene_type:complete
MANNYKSVKGTKDLLPSESVRYRNLEGVIHGTMELWGYGEIRTPVFEDTSLFARSVGEESDIVTKQMYTFLDQSKNSLTLKPELTAPVMRAYLQHNLSRQGAMTKLYYMDTLFRQERPQAGRLRQFRQFGAEAIGSPHPEQDAEIITLVIRILDQLGIKNTTLHLNSIGSRESRKIYLKVLVEYLNDQNDQLSELSQSRLKKNPLRILDSKHPDEQKIIKEAPNILEHLSLEDIDHYGSVKEHLDMLDIDYSETPTLVRGLDYYTRTTFEITSPDVGAQSAICGGGRYDDLIGDLGGPSTPAVGFAAGVERIILALQQEELPLEKNSLIYIAAASNDARNRVFTLAEKLRANNVPVEFDTLHRSLKAQMRDANRMSAGKAVIIGDEELENNSAVVKDLSSGEQKKVSIDELNNYLLDG